MFGKPSLIMRIAIGKGIGFLFGLMGFVMLPLFVAEAGMMLRLGVLFWYVTVGAIIGVFGVFTYHPVLHMPMPWWFRSALLGGWMNFVLLLFIYDLMTQMMTNFFGAESAISSPFWFVFEGALVGLIIGYFATRFGGEGKDIIS